MQAGRVDCLVFGHCGHSAIADGAIKESVSNVGMS
jgi:hypothetical protein